MEYKFLKYLKQSELTQLEDIILGITSCEDLQKQIQSLKNKSFDFADYNFSSSYIPHYDRELEDKCIEILKQLRANDLFFFLISFKNKGNTHDHYLKVNFDRELPNGITKNDLDDLRNLIFYAYQDYGNHFHYAHEQALCLDKVNNIFENSKLQEYFEGPYNMFNYIKNYIYLLLKQENEITKEDVFSNYQDKKQLVTIQLKEISSYLYEIRNGTNLRLCISNAGLSSIVTKKGNQFTIDQQLFIDALAFGTTLQKIENRDYEDYKKLLYLPKRKELIK